MELWSALNDRWANMLDTNAQMTILITGTTVAHEGVWLLSNLPYTFLNLAQIPFFEKYKIQKGKSPSLKEVWMTALLVFLEQLFVLAPAVFITQFMFNFSWSRELPSPWVMAMHVAFCLIAEDFGLYWTHRLLHVPWFYKRFHKQHHYYQSPFSWASEYSHPVELILSNYFPTMLGAWLIRIHVTTFWVWVALRLWLTTEVHCGYNFPWNLERFIPFYAGPVHHDRHHEAFNGNYASSLKLWDYLCGTQSKLRLGDSSKPKAGSDASVSTSAAPVSESSPISQQVRPFSKVAGEGSGVETVPSKSIKTE